MTMSRKLERPRLLVADDDVSRLWLRVALSPFRAHVAEARNGHEFLDALADQGPYDLVITDAALPRPSGLQVASMARTAGVETPFVVLSSSLDPDVAKTVRAIGHAVLLGKPFERATLVGVVHRLLERGLRAFDPASRERA
jgi:CheY-like chemotaxis protein